MSTAIAVELASAIDPTSPWIDTARTSLLNVRKLVDLYLEQPLPLLTTISRNWVTYIKELPDVGLIASQVAGNIRTFLTAPWSAGDLSYSYLVSLLPITTPVPFLGSLSQQDFYNLTPIFWGGGYDRYAPFVDFTATPASGVVAGVLGPLVAPLIQMTDSLTLIKDFIRAGDAASALKELINVPAKVTNAVLNGGKYLDLTGALAALGVDLADTGFKRVGLNLGGLLSVVPTCDEGGTACPPPPGAPGNLSGGVAFDGVAAEVSKTGPPFGTFDMTSPGLPVGAIGSVIGLNQFLADQLLVTPPADEHAVSQADAVPAATDAAPVAPETPSSAVVENPAAIEPPATTLDRVSAPVEATAEQQVSARARRGAGAISARPRPRTPARSDSRVERHTKLTRAPHSQTAAIP
ncbi:MAG: hypothetical protein ACKOQ4_07585 [Mycobacterium sp.]